MHHVFLEITKISQKQQRDKQYSCTVHIKLRMLISNENVNASSILFFARES